MTTPLNSTKLGLLLPTVLNPATAVVVGIGFGLLWLLREDEQETTVGKVPSKSPQPAVGTVVEPLPAIEAKTDKAKTEASETPLPTTTELDQKEMIRNAMSELGKRSAAARAKKKTEMQEQG